jgi:hypothetical protein
MTKLQVVGEGALLFNVLPVVPLWMELSGPYYPPDIRLRNLLVDILLASVPCLICLLLSHRLYRLSGTVAPIVACVLSLGMFAGINLLWYAAYNGGEKGLKAIFLMIIQDLVGIVVFAALRFWYRHVHASMR